MWVLVLLSVVLRRRLCRLTLVLPYRTGDDHGLVDAVGPQMSCAGVATTTRYRFIKTVPCSVVEPALPISMKPTTDSARARRARDR